MAMRHFQWSPGCGPHNQGSGHSASQQGKVHLRTLRERSEIERMTPRERMRLRKLQTADEKAGRLRLPITYLLEREREREREREMCMDKTVVVLGSSQCPTVEDCGCTVQLPVSTSRHCTGQPSVHQ
ncbi:Serine/threonine-protein kinase Nek11 [Merluccius polli]|uniref:Serine/threonine-protein kinase Nek11 n=1 Tax=Merluccius polli TaxID=89951 RepID=A0AA47P9I0_MERPO|nr:Serine/threonine-protein kinase Nek11 [Merluccius polli]